MRVQDWTSALARHPAFETTRSFLHEGGELHSVPAELRPVLAAIAFLEHPRHTLIVTANHERTLHWQAKLELAGVRRERIRQLPSGISSLFEDAAPEHQALSDRIGALRAMVADEPVIVIATISSALERTLPPDVLRDVFVTLKPSMRHDPDELIRQLTVLGYEHQEPVREPGQFSRRGGILDVYPMGSELPIRIEFFGDEIESLRRFDPMAQRSVGQLASYEITPSRETLFPPEPTDFREMLTRSATMEADRLPEEAANRLEEIIVQDAQALDDKVFFDRLDLYRPLLYPESGSAIDLLGEEGLLILDEPLELEAIANRAHDELDSGLEARHHRGEILHSTASDYLQTVEHVAYAKQRLALTSMNSLPDWLSSQQTLDIRASSLEPYRGRAEALTLAIRNWKEQALHVTFATDQPHRCKTVLHQVEIFPNDSELNLAKPVTSLVQGNLGGGFLAPEWGIALVTDAELFGVRRLRLPQKRFREGAPITTVLDLKPGDYVVHIQHGIGVFRGLVKREFHGSEREFLYIEYAKPDKLFVPADQLDRVQKYLNPGETEPKINRLTGTEWQKTLKQAREDAEKFARELVTLYAKRKEAIRPPLGPDTPFQGEMEATFPWVETPTQLQAIEEVKSDLQNDYPMDRLVCGDVGFGKTEVAIRAAFKVLQSGRQVAVLCPTTILSEQHYRNFKERLGPFGTRMALLNRFKTTKERKEILDDLRKGVVEIIIGTHALLGKEITFRDLGLLVVDEEQKFGVKQKEAIKNLRVNVDVLTLSATPIPRTLSMALMDLRQMSLITDPPPGRLPIRTFVRGYSDEVVREAMLRELARGGQVYYVHNRVQGIEHIAEKLQKLVPMARIGVGHGQMSEKELEPIMVAFIRGEIDVLLSTTIIESGLDIPNANTLIVENADRLGLAQLYQLRGRVGRSDVQAYAYLLYQGARDLNDQAMSRLQALQEFSTLGSGYSLAFRDLQIRGAGELLGAKQHGAMAAVGYELYTQLIEAAVQSLKSKVDPYSAAEPVDISDHTPLPAFDLPVKAYLPSSYIEDSGQRLYYYQRMMGCREPEALAEVQAEIEDRYGHPPAEVVRAFRIMRARMIGRDYGFEKLDANAERLLVHFAARRRPGPRVFTLLHHRHRNASLVRDALVWGYQGDALVALEQLLEAFGSAVARVEADRANLGVVEHQLQ